MFDGKQIARQALLRAEELKADKKRRRIQRTISILSLCTASVIIVLLIIPFGNLSDNYIGELSDESLLNDDIQVPLADFSLPQIDENATLCTGTEQGITIPDIRNITIDADTLDISTTLFNPENNPYYFQYEIVLTNSDEAIYNSDLIKPGMCVETPTLARTLTKGEYDAVLKIHYYGMESYTFINSVDISLNLIVA